MTTATRTILLAAAAFASATLAAARAGELRPVEASVIDLGGVSGVAYYTVERDGFRVVATFAEGEAGAPVRVETLLTPGQTLVLSAPREPGAAPETVEISRQDDRVLVHGAAATN